MRHEFAGRVVQRAGLVLVIGVVTTVALHAELARGRASPEMQLEASSHAVTWGDAISFTGVVSSPDAPECAQGVEVVLEMDRIDDGDLRLQVARARTDETGQFSMDVRAEDSAMYAAETVPAEGSGCEAAGSGAVEVKVKFEVTVERSALAVPRGGEVKLQVRVEPICPYDRTGDIAKIPLYELRGDRFVRVAAKRDVNDCTVTFTRRIRQLSVFMSKVRGLDLTNVVYLPGRSAEVAVTVRS